MAGSKASVPSGWRGPDPRVFQPARRSEVHPCRHQPVFRRVNRDLRSELLSGALLDCLRHSREKPASQASFDPDEESGVTSTPSPPASCNLAQCMIDSPQSCGQWYTLPPPHEPNFSAPLITLPCDYWLRNRVKSENTLCLACIFGIGFPWSPICEASLLADFPKCPAAQGCTRSYHNDIVVL